MGKARMSDEQKAALIATKAEALRRLLFSDASALFGEYEPQQACEVILGALCAASSMLVGHIVTEYVCAQTPESRKNLLASCIVTASPKLSHVNTYVETYKKSLH